MSAQSEKLTADIRTLVRDAEELIKATAAETSEKVVDLRRRMQQSVTEIKSNVVKLEDAVVERAKPAAQACDQYVHSHPWTAIGISTMAGLLIGLLANRR